MYICDMCICVHISYTTFVLSCDAHRRCGNATLLSTLSFAATHSSMRASEPSDSSDPHKPDTPLRLAAEPIPELLSREDELLVTLPLVARARPIHVACTSRRAAGTSEALGLALLDGESHVAARLIKHLLELIRRVALEDVAQLVHLVLRF